MKNVNNTPSMESMEQNAASAEKLLKLLANRHRLMILCNLVEQERSVTELIDIVGLSQSAVSQHLAKLKQEGVVSADKSGQQVFYRLASMEVNALLSTLYLIYCK